MFYIGGDCQIHPSATINVLEGFIGNGSIIREDAVIEGRLVEIGREAVIGRRAHIGGGSCFTEGASLRAGDWMHMGTDSHINTATGVEVGHSFGLGVGSKIFTHGAYLDSFNLGAPSQWGSVTIGDNVWLPHAWVNPGVNIGSNVVISAMSLVNRDIPSGSLAGGIPVKILKEKFLPRKLNDLEKGKLIYLILDQLKNRSDFNKNTDIVFKNNILFVLDGESKSIFDLDKLTIAGQVSSNSVIVKDQLRRHGIRFRYSPMNAEWEPWEKDG